MNDTNGTPEHATPHIRTQMGVAAQREASLLATDPDVQRVFQLFINYRNAKQEEQFSWVTPLWDAALNKFLAAKTGLSKIKLLALFELIRKWNEERDLALKRGRSPQARYSPIPPDCMP